MGDVPHALASSSGHYIGNGAARGGGRIEPLRRRAMKEGVSIGTVLVIVLLLIILL